MKKKAYDFLGEMQKAENAFWDSVLPPKRKKKRKGGRRALPRR